MKILIALQIMFYLMLIGFVAYMWWDMYKMHKRHKKVIERQKMIISILTQTKDEDWKAKKLYYRLLQAKEHIKDEDVMELSIMNLMLKDLEPHTHE